MHDRNHKVSRIMLIQDNRRIIKIARKIHVAHDEKCTHTCMPAHIVQGHDKDELTCG